MTGWEMYLQTVSGHAFMLRDIVINQPKWPKPGQYRGFNEKPRGKV